MMNRSRTIHRVLVVLSLSSLLACGGGGGGSTAGTAPVPPPGNAYATTLTYTNPANGTYRFVKSQVNSTPTHLVLDLIGPPGKLSGIGFFLTADTTKVLWAPVGSNEAEKLRNTLFSNAILQSKVSGETLQAGVFQKGMTAPVTTREATVLASVALDLRTQVPLSGSNQVNLSAGKALILNDPADPSATSTIVITMGSLSVQ